MFRTSPSFHLCSRLFCKGPCATAWAPMSSIGFHVKVFLCLEVVTPFRESFVHSAPLQDAILLVCFEVLGISWLLHFSTPGTQGDVWTPTGSFGHHVGDPCVSPVVVLLQSGVCLKTHASFLRKRTVECCGAGFYGVHALV